MNLICQRKFLLYLVKTPGAFFALTQPGQLLLDQVGILEIFQMCFDRRTYVERCGVPGVISQTFHTDAGVVRQAICFLCGYSGLIQLVCMYVF